MADQSADAAADDERVEERRSSPLKSPRVRLALLVGAIAIVAAGLLWYFDRETRGKYMQSTDNAYVSADSVVVAPKIAGYVERVLVTENQAVRQGQPLAELDPREYRAQTQQITSQIEAATASTETTRSQIAEQQAAICCMILRDNGRGDRNNFPSTLRKCRSQRIRWSGLKHVTCTLNSGPF